MKFLFCLYLLFLVWAEATVTSPADPDLWHRLALGEALWQTGHFPPGDAFSYLADYQQIADHEWGGALIFYGLYHWGDGAFVIAKLVTLAVTMMLVVFAGWQGRGPSMLLAGLYALVLLALLPSFQSTVRCMTFTHVFFALWLYWFQRERHGRPVPTSWYVLTMVVWANLHGGFAMGLAWLLFVLLLEVWEAKGKKNGWARDAKRGGIRLLLCGLATLINPFGFQLWVSTLNALTTTRKGFGEWAPVSWSDVGGYPGYKLLLLVVVAALARQIYRVGWRRIDRTAVLLIGAFLAMSLISARHTSLFAVVVGALLPGLLPPEDPVESMDDPIQRLGAIAGKGLLVVVPFFTAILILAVGPGLRLEYKPDSCPVQAVDYLQRQGIRGKLLVPFNYGSYALWQLRGRMRVSMDGRYDLVYKPATFRRVEDFFFARGDWKSLLASPAPDAILVPLTDEVYPKLLVQPGWSQAWHNDTDAVFLPKR